MATTLTTGLKLILPNTGDKGSIWFPALEHNITQTNDHVHDGSVGAQIPSTNILPVKQTISASNWVVEVANQTWSQEVTLPANVSYSDVFIMVKNDVGEQLFLDIKPVTGQDNKYKVYTNDNGLNATAHLLV